VVVPFSMHPCNFESYYSYNDENGVKLFDCSRLLILYMRYYHSSGFDYTLEYGEHGLEVAEQSFERFKGINQVPRGI